MVLRQRLCAAWLLVCSPSLAVGLQAFHHQSSLGVTTLHDILVLALRSVEVFDISGEAWSSIAPMSCARRRLGVTAFYGAIYAIGGENRSGILSSVEKYKPSTGLWMSVQSLGI
ncbi:hypothetical protein T265_14054, partial [Opisthorchis viverrini]